MSPSIHRLTAAAAKMAAVQDRGPVCAYLYDLTGLRAWAAGLKASLPTSCQLYYAIKANSDARVLGALAGVVDGLEVASLGEVAKARAVASDIPVLFGGPGKTDDELAGALAANVSLLHVESAHELRRIEHAAAQAQRRIPVLLRVNLAGPLPAATLKMAGSPTQFGIDEAELPSAMSIATRCRHLEVQGFHLHSLSNNLDAEAHLALVRLYLDRLADWQRLLGRPAPVLNIGGGIGVDYGPARRQFDWQGFCRGLQSLLRHRGGQEMRVILECGRFVTADFGAYAVEVLDLKQNHGAVFAIVRGGTHHFRLPASWQHSHPFQVVPVERWCYPFERPEICAARMTVAGQLCTPKDVLARDVPVARLRIGDVLLFTGAGAYGWSISHHDFLSHPHPQMVYLDGDAGA